MKKNFTILFLLFSVFSFSQNNWEKTLGGSQDDEIKEIYLEDSYFIAVGVTYSSGMGNQDIFVLKSDYNGNILWQKTYGSIYLESIRENCITKTINDEFIIVGASINLGGEPDILMFKISSSGNLIWKKHYGETYWDNATGGIVNLTDSTFFVSAGGEINNTSSIVYDHNMIIDIDGNILTDNVVGQALNENYPHSAMLTSDSNLVYVGTSKVNPWEPSLRVLDKDANFIYGKQYLGGAQADIFEVLEETSDSNFVVGGYTNSFTQGLNDFLFAKINKNDGTIISQKSIGNSGIDRIWDSYYDDTDSTIYFVGEHFNPLSGNIDGIILQLNENIDTLGIWCIGGTDDDMLLSISKKNGRFVIAGKTKSKGNGLYDGWILSTDDFNSLCNLKNYSLIETSTSFSATSFGANTTSIAAEVSLTFSDTFSSFDFLNYDCNSCLVAKYDFNGNANDLSGWGNHGTEVGGVTYVDDRYGNANSAIELDGTGPYINIPNASQIDFDALYDDYMVSFWIKSGDPMGTGVNSYILSKNNNAITNGYPFVFRTGDNTQINTAIAESPTVSNTFNYVSPNIWDNNWHKINFVVDNALDSAYFYFDGKCVGVFENVITLTTKNGEPVRFGMSSSLDRPYKGILDELKMFSCSYTKEEIDSIWRVECVPFETSQNINICNGDSVYLGGSFQYNSGIFVDTLIASNNCDSIVTTTLTVSNTSTNTISGVVYYQSSPITSGEVRLIRKDGNSPQTMVYIDSVAVNPDGTYEFSNLNLIPGNYMVKALGDTSIYDNVATYADSTNHWQWANIFAISGNCNDTISNVDVRLIDFPTTIGFGSISGTIEENGGPLFKAPGDPIPDIDITVEQSPGGAISGFDISDENGQFDFTNLPPGDYYIYADIPGYVCDTTYILNFDGSGLNYDVTVCVYDTINTIVVCNNVLTSFDEIETYRNVFELYPNPVNDVLFVNNSLNENYNLTITDISGKTVLTKFNLKAKNTIDLSNLENGIYFIELISKEIRQKQKLIIQK